MTPKALLHPVEGKYLGFAVKLLHGASHPLSDSLNPNSTEIKKHTSLIIRKDGTIEKAYAHACLIDRVKHLYRY